MHRPINMQLVDNGTKRKDKDGVNNYGNTTAAMYVSPCSAVAHSHGGAVFKIWHFVCNLRVGLSRNDTI